VRVVVAGIGTLFGTMDGQIDRAPIVLGELYGKASGQARK